MTLSLTSLLLGSNAKIDTDLDNLFNVQVPLAAPTTTTSLSAPRAAKKRKVESIDKDSATTTPKKRARHDTLKKLQPGSPKASGTHSTDTKVRKETSRKNKQIAVEHEAENDDESDSDNSDLENAYASKVSATSKAINKVAETDEVDDAIPVHESLASGAKHRTKATKRKHVPEDETPETRNRRTIFVGNLPLDVLSKKLVKKQLQRHILSFVPTAKIESIRFRSIPFQVPTTKLPDLDDEGDSKTSKREARVHARQRSSNWRANQGDKGEDGGKTDEKKFLTPAQKKKIAYINQEFHTTADVVNAYIVFAHPTDAGERPANLPPLPPTMNPYQAALQATADANGSVFMDRVLRVDLVGKAKTIVGKAREDGAISIPEGHPRSSIFVGNLDFASKEEDLRAFFEGLMCTERGPPGQSEEAPNPTKKRPTWVIRVRVVRDNETQLGKGFAYVEFIDQECVDEILAMEESKLKFAKRKLRVQRCKTVPGTGVKHSSPEKKPSAKNLVEKSGRSKEVCVIPKGDPSLGEKLVGLSKEERKQRKSTNPDRVARRLAKKKLRMAMGPTVGKTLRKERNRVRSKDKRI